MITVTDAAQLVVRIGGFLQRSAGKKPSSKSSGNTNSLSAAQKLLDRDGHDPMRDELQVKDRVAFLIDLYKKDVDVQQHFNDIEWRIRGLALTVATFALGAAGVAAKDGAIIGPVSLGSGVVILGLLLWYAFYFVDRTWYHALLRASVNHGKLLEQELQKYIPQAGLTQAISSGSTNAEIGVFDKSIAAVPSIQVHKDDGLNAKTRLVLQNRRISFCDWRGGASDRDYVCTTL